MARIKPEITLSTISEPGLIFNSRCPDNMSSWQFADKALADAVTGNQIPILGNTPILCSRGSGTKAVLSFLKETGFDLNPTLHQYFDENDRLRLLRDLIEKGNRIIVQHMHSTQDLAKEHCWVPPETLAYLNNKENLPGLVSPAYINPRKILPPSRIRSILSQDWDLPVVIKVVTNSSSGGGNGVLICKTPDDLIRAEKIFDTCEQVIVERFMYMRQNLCLNYLIDAQAKVKYLGAAEQIINPEGCYLGNWLDKNIQIPTKLVNEGFSVMRNAASHGYRGFAGFDVALCADGLHYIYDLNFRFNGSTVPILLHNSASSAMGRELLKFRSWCFKGGIQSLLKILCIALDKYLLLPFNIYDPLAGARKDADTRVFGMLFGSSREEITENEKNLFKLGLV